MFFITFMCLMLILCGVIYVNTNFYSVIVSDSGKNRVAQMLNEDKTPIKVFKDINENNELYPMIDNEKNKSVLVFYNTDPFDMTIEGQRYCVYINDGEGLKYKNEMRKVRDLAENKCSGIIEYIRQKIIKAVEKDTSY